MQITGGSPGLSYHLAKPPLKTPFETPLNQLALSTFCTREATKVCPAQPQKAANALLGIVGVCGCHESRRPFALSLPPGQLRESESESGGGESR